MIGFVRALLFNALFFGGTAVLCLVLWPGILVKGRHLAWMARLWAGWCLWSLRVAAGLDHIVRGAANIAPGPVLYASKHQSAWDTIVFFTLLPRPAYVLKEELLLIPIIGWYLRRAGMIAIDRRGGAKALRGMLASAQARVREGREIVIFPEGTRTPPGERRTHHPGVAALYARLGLPVVPVALNSGHFWRRRGFTKRAGTIVIEFLEPIAPGLERETFSRLLQERIETACARLSAEAPPSS
jgi:1-acyl-sn-glycerol-3-phosphate acyltransferase